MKQPETVRLVAALAAAVMATLHGVLPHTSILLAVWFALLAVMPYEKE